MKVHLFKWLRGPEVKRSSYCGIRVRDVRVDAPPIDAPDQQWLDFAAVAGLFCVYSLFDDPWRERALRAYLAKWPRVAQ